MAERPSYTKEQREAAVADVPALGVNTAAKKHGVSQTNVSRWARVAGVQREGGRGPSSTPKASKEGARSRRKRKETTEEKWTREVQVAAAAEAESAPPKVVATVEASEDPVAPATQPPVRRPLKKRVAMIYTPSQKAEVLEHAAAHGITEASKKFSVSRFSIYGWQRKVSNAAASRSPPPRLPAWRTPHSEKPGAFGPEGPSSLRAVAAVDRGPQVVSGVAEGDERGELALDAAEDRGTRCVSVGSATADLREQFVTKDRGVQQATRTGAAHPALVAGRRCDHATRVAGGGGVRTSIG